MQAFRCGLTARVCLFALLAPSAVFAGPFGLEIGMRIDQIDKNAKALGDGKYSSKSAPKPHPAFETYVYQVGPSLGLCWIKAVGKDIPTGNYGVELKLAFSEMKLKLEQNYGKSALTDALMPKSIWHEPADFMMSLLQRERYLTATWDGESGASLPSDLRSVFLIAKASDRSTGYISVEYEFRNKDRCDREIDQKTDSVL